MYFSFKTCSHGALCESSVDKTVENPAMVGACVCCGLGGAAGFLPAPSCHPSPVKGLCRAQLEAILGDLLSSSKGSKMIYLSNVMGWWMGGGGVGRGRRWEQLHK